MPSELETLLSAYQREGQFESTGTFTVDHQKLREKLAHFLLPEPQAYILKLVQWAVSGGASKIKVEVGRQRVLFAHDGTPPDGHLLREWVTLLEARWQGLPEPSLHLALGLNALQELQPAQVRVLARGQRGTLEHIFDGQETRQAESEESGENLTILSVEGRSPAFGSGLAAQLLSFGRRTALGRGSQILRSKVQLAEKALLHSCCAYCPIPLRVNGVYVNRPFFDVSAQHQRTRKGRLNCLMMKAKNYHTYAFVYQLHDGPSLELLSPSYHPGALLSSWYSLQERSPALETKSRNILPAKGMVDWKVDSGLYIEGQTPLNTRIATAVSFSPLAPAAQVCGVLRGVCIESDRDETLPKGSFTVLSHSELGSDLSGLRIKKSQARRDVLAEHASRVEAALQRRRF